MQSSIVLLIVGLAAVNAQLNLNNLGSTVASLLNPVPTPVLGNIIPASLNQLPLPTALLSYTPQQISEAVAAISDAGSKGQNLLLTTVAQGVTVPTGNLLYNNISVGAVTLPPGYLCSDTSATNVALNLTLLTSCYVCSADCTWVHNKYGGFCGLQTNAASNQYQKTSVCVCGDTAPADGHVLTPYEQCGPLINNTAQYVNDIAGILIQYALLGRENAQCVPTANAASGSLVTYNSAACQVDCTTNHQYSCGICDQEAPIPLNAGQTSTGTQAFCGCYYGGPDANNGTQCSSTPKTTQ